MIIKRIKVSNYKTYLNLDLDLSVNSEQPIILIGGMNGGGKTTLFEAICGALYGLEIKNKQHFNELLNNGAFNKAEHKIELELTFVGLVLGQEQKYILKRTYVLNPAEKPVESVSLNMNGNIFVYGTATPPAQRAKSEQQVNKIIKANLPQELSQYFLFDAMQSSKLLEENMFAQIIRDNIENVMGFNKYIQLKRASEKLLQEWTVQRMNAQKEIEEYEGLCKDKLDLENKINCVSEDMDKLYKYLAAMKESYDKAKSGEEDENQTKIKIQQLDSSIQETIKKVIDYSTSVKGFVENLELNIFLPKIASNMSVEINGILKLKDDLKQGLGGQYTPEEVFLITKDVLDYLKEFALCSSDIDLMNVANYILAKQKRTDKQDDYAFLDDSEVDALKGLLNINYTNDFLQLDRTRQELEERILNLSNQKIQKEAYERSQIRGNFELIKDYEAKETQIKRLEEDKLQISDDIARLNKRIHQYDVQIQQEPDIKYDTLAKMKPFFEDVVNSLLRQKKLLIENEMQKQLNMLLLSYKGCIARVELSDTLDNFAIKLYHKAGNEISLNQLNAASKQIFIQVLLKVLRNLGDYNPPVMIDTVMGVLDEESRDVLMEEYFPQLAEQTILLCTTSEIRKDSDYLRLEPFISKTYTLKRNVEGQNTVVENGYFGINLKD
jgi:DNA sulfur modification protein DndD